MVYGVWTLRKSATTTPKAIKRPLSLPNEKVSAVSLASPRKCREKKGSDPHKMPDFVFDVLLRVIPGRGYCTAVRRG